MSGTDRIYWLHALTPLHVGSGKGEGYIDLPLIREKVTNYPFVPGSSVKGVFADACDATESARDPKNRGNGYREDLHAAFGRTGTDLSNSGALVFTDARLVCLAVRSLFGTFAWSTCPMILARLHRDLEAGGFPNLPTVPSTRANSEAHVPAVADPQSLAGTCLASGPKICLEDFDLTAKPCSVAANWAKAIATSVFGGPTTDWGKIFTSRFVVLPDDVFGFLAETGTEVQPHVRINEEFKCVADGALWYEESLPAESILAGVLWCDKPRLGSGNTSVTQATILALTRQERSLQLGGKATTGKGRVRLKFVAPAVPPTGGNS